MALRVWNSEVASVGGYLPRRVGRPTGSRRGPSWSRGHGKFTLELGGRRLGTRAERGLGKSPEKAAVDYFQRLVYWLVFYLGFQIFLRADFSICSFCAVLFSRYHGIRGPPTFWLPRRGLSTPGCRMVMGVRMYWRFVTFLTTCGCAFREAQDRIRSGELSGRELHGRR